MTTDHQGRLQHGIPTAASLNHSHCVGMPHEPTAPTSSSTMQAFHPQPRSGDSTGPSIEDPDGVCDLGVQPPESSIKTPILAPALDSPSDSNSPADLEAELLRSLIGHAFSPHDTLSIGKFLARLRELYHLTIITQLWRRCKRSPCRGVLCSQNQTTSQQDPTFAFATTLPNSLLSPPFHITLSHALNTLTTADSGQIGQSELEASTCPPVVRTKATLCRQLSHW